MYQVNSESFEHDETLGENFEEEERLDQGARQRVSYQLKNYDCLQIMTLCNLQPFTNDDNLLLLFAKKTICKTFLFANNTCLQDSYVRPGCLAGSAASGTTGSTNSLASDGEVQ